MIERLFLDRVDAESGGAAIRGQHHPVVNVLADETGTALACVQFAVTRAEVALESRRCAFFTGQCVPPARWMCRFGGFYASFHFRTP